MSSWLSPDAVSSCGSGALSTLERCLLEAPGRLGDMLDHGVVVELLGLLENISLLLLGVLYGAQESPPQENGTPGGLGDWPQASCR